MHLLIPTLFHMKYPTEPSKASPFVLTEKPKTVHQLLEFMLDVLLMPYGWVGWWGWVCLVFWYGYAWN